MTDGYSHVTGGGRLEPCVKCCFHDVIEALVADHTSQLQQIHTTVQSAYSRYYGGVWIHEYTVRGNSLI